MPQHMVCQSNEVNLSACSGVQGHAFEARLYAENVANNFLPATGTVQRWQVPANASVFDNSSHVRIDSGVSEGDTVRVYSLGNSQNPEDS